MKKKSEKGGRIKLFEWTSKYCSLVHCNIQITRAAVSHI